MYKLTYIWHDCFVYEHDGLMIVFDYWKDPLVGKGELPLFLRGVDPGKEIYVVVSHHHKDHYVKDIFGWSGYFPRIHYVLSADTARFARHILGSGGLYKGIRPRKENVSVLVPGETYSDSNVSVKAFGSTDIGNSYAVMAGGVRLFHAGDLNAWIWKDESTPEEVESGMRDYREILDDIASAYPAFDMAMFPVDSRIGSDYFTGAREFVRKIHVAHFFPMHFGLGSPAEQLRHQLDAAQVENYANPHRGDYICLQSPYSCYLTHC